MKKHTVPRKRFSPGALLIGIVGSNVLGSIGSIATMPKIPTWYATLIKPSFSPPNWIFAPVWTILFTLMGIAAFLVWREGTERKTVKIALWMFGIQFFFNILWSFAFFGFESPSAGLLVIMVVWFLIAFTIVAFRNVNKTAGALLVPYYLWVTFAMILNASVYRLNG